ncbi:PE-PPE domain-containing protein [Mycolicibacterium mucogenicum]|uniref:PE-PPE domain-containing protein n=1 Tax=Mycolicibacterium mucogenicum TaxID=56689 RepID=UPI000926E708|nr:PE-PPE domain-containing protein [Mycolicibacterium mucogenicum]SHU72989.1 PE-PPE domain-containing protein [Mycobacteroides abscessus subsp. abscessus]
MSVQMLPATSPAVRGVPRVFLLVALCCALLVSPATNITSSFVVGLMNTVIGIGGRGDPTSANIPAKLNHTVVPPGYAYLPINYPASIQLSASTTVSGPKVYNAITSRPGEQLIVAGYSEGSLGAEWAKRRLLANGTGPAPSQLSFVMIGSPFAGNGGIFERFPGINVPFIVNNQGPSAPSPYDTTFYTREYDPYADFPAYFNPLSLANSLLGVMYAHPDTYYDSYIPGTTPAIITVVPDNGAGGTDTYVFIKTPELPLLVPLRIGAGAIGLTPLVKPLLDAVEPLLRVLVDMGYTDRENLHPEKKTPFSLFTPLSKIVETLNAIPGALQEGADNFVNDIRSELHLPALAATPAASPPVTTLDASAKKTAALAPVAATAEDKPAATDQKTTVEAPEATKTDAKTDPKADAPADTKTDTKTDPDAKATGTDEPKAKSPKPEADPDTPPVKSTKPKTDPDNPPTKTPKPKKKKNGPAKDAGDAQTAPAGGSTSEPKDGAKRESSHAAA